MKCKKCGHENEDGQRKCSNCQTPLYPRFQIMWKGILAGIITAFLVLALDYMVYGKEGWFFFGLIFATIISGLVTTIFIKRKNIKAADDLNPILNSFLAGAIFYLLSLPVYTFHVSIITLMVTIGFGLFGFIGGTVGLFINIFREQKFIWKITGIIIIILFLSTMTYGLFFSNLSDEHEYYTNLGQYFISPMYLVDAIDNETVNKLNETPIYNIKNHTLLKDTSLRYQRMKNLTNFSLIASDEFIYSHASNSIEKEYAISLKKYFNLRLEYYAELEKSANLTIAGNKSQAISHYKKAQKLIHQIEKQKTTFESIENKNSDFKKRINNLIIDAKEMVSITKKTNSWMDPSTF